MASGFASPQHEQDEASPTCWGELRRRDEVATDYNLDDSVDANAYADADTTDVLDDEEIGQLLSCERNESDDTKYPDTNSCAHIKPGDGGRRPSEVVG